jgi:hypothetical protein
MMRPSGIVALSALVLAFPLLIASDSQAGSALVPPTKTPGITLNATIVIDVTQTVTTNPITGVTTYQGDTDTGLTSITVQKASAVTAAIFRSGYVQGAVWTADCTKPAIFPDPALDLPTTVAVRFTGLIDALVAQQTTAATEDILNALFLSFGTPHRAAIVAQNYLTCTQVGQRHILSFSAVIQFCVPPSVGGKFCL